MPETVEIYEVGPRDGLQNDPRELSAAWKIGLVNRLSRCGFARVEVASFVSPKLVPRMRESADVLEGLVRAPGVRYAALVPNLRGYAAAMAAGADEVAVFASASEGFSQANLNCSVAESLERFAPVMDAARADGIPVRGYVSCVTDCPFDGPTPPRNAARLAAALMRLGCHEISLGDTIGRATPESVRRMLDSVLDRVGPESLAAHFHDTCGRALANIEEALNAGLRVFDASIGGLGGCPFAPGSPGNVATEAVARLLSRHGYATRLDLDMLDETSKYARDQ